MHVTHLESALDGTRLDVSTLQEPYRLKGKKTMGLAGCCAWIYLHNSFQIWKINFPMSGI